MKDRSEELDEKSKINDPLTEKVIGCAITIHRVLGPGFLENIYHRALAHEVKRKFREFNRPSASSMAPPVLPVAPV